MKDVEDLCYIGNVLTENRSGLVVDTLLTQASGSGERSAAATTRETSC